MDENEFDFGDLSLFFAFGGGNNYVDNLSMLVEVDGSDASFEVSILSDVTDFILRLTENTAVTTIAARIAKLINKVNICFRVILEKAFFSHICVFWNNSLTFIRRKTPLSLFIFDDII